LNWDGQGLGASPYLGGNKEIGVGAVTQARGPSARAGTRGEPLHGRPSYKPSVRADVSQLRLREQSREEKWDLIPFQVYAAAGSLSAAFPRRGELGARGYLHSNAKRVVQRLGRGKRKGFHGDQDGPWQFISLPSYRGIFASVPGHSASMNVSPPGFMSLTSVDEDADATAPATFFQATPTPPHANLAPTTPTHTPTHPNPTLLKY